LHLPILRRAGGPDLRPRRPPLQGRRDHLGERRRRLLGLQPEEGRQVAFGCKDVAGDRALSADGPRPPPERAPVPAQLPPRELDGLPLLGQRAGGVSLGPAVLVATKPFQRLGVKIRPFCSRARRARPRRRRGGEHGNTIYYSCIAVDAERRRGVAALAF